jgi:putative endonuclease
MIKSIWNVYLVRCADNSLYCGITNRLANRLKAHNAGKGAKYTRSRRPVALEAISHNMTKSEALKLEYHLKQVPAHKKIQELTRQEDNMAADLKSQLQQVSKEIKALAKKVDKLVTAAGKVAKPAKPKAKKAAPKKAAAKKKAPAKKAAVEKKASAKKAVAKKKAPAKKAAKETAADAVLKVVNRAKKGVNTADIMKKTGFDNKKVANIIFKLKKQGKIANPEKGLYVKA